MAQHKEKNPFYVEDEFRVPPVDNRYYRSDADIDDLFSKPICSTTTSIQAQKQNSANRQLDGTRRALAALHESEQIGTATAEELLRQGEQLDNVEDKVTEINQDMKTSQKHLNNIKSVFGGFKNWWSGKKEKEEEAKMKSQSYVGDSRLTHAVEKEREVGLHPAMQLRTENMQGFYADDMDTSSSKLPGQRSAQQQRAGPQATGYDTQLDDNLGMMSSGLSNLKELALGLGSEMDKQNDQLERVNSKVERADILITDQNRQMRSVLGVKK